LDIGGGNHGNANQGCATPQQKSQKGHDQRTDDHVPAAECDRSSAQEDDQVGRTCFGLHQGRVPRFYRALNESPEFSGYELDLERSDLMDVKTIADIGGAIIKRFRKNGWQVIV
jgi:hypothetical protein